MNARYRSQEPVGLKPPVQTAVGNSHFNPFYRKVPYRVVPVLSANFLSEKSDSAPASGENRSQAETPRLPDPEEVAKADYSKRFGTESSDFQSVDNSQKCARAMFNLRFQRQQSSPNLRSSSASTKYTQTESIYRPKTNMLTPGKDAGMISNKIQRTSSVLGAKTPIVLRPFDSSLSNSRHVNRFAYNSYERTENTPLPETAQIVDNHEKDRKYASIRPFSCSPKPSEKKRELFYPSTLESNCKFSNDNLRANQSLVGKIVRKSRESGTIQRSASQSRLMDSNVRSYRAKVEAFFWDPAELKSKKADSHPSPVVTKTPVQEQSKYFPEDTFSGKSEMMSQVFQEVQSMYPEIASTPHKENVVDTKNVKKLETSFAKPLGQNNVLTERNLSSLFNSPKFDASREIVDKPLQIDVRKVQEILQQPEPLAKTEAHEVTQDEAFKKKNEIAITETGTIGNKQMKRIGSPKFYNSKTKKPNVKEEKAIDEPEPDWLACTESGPGCGLVNTVRICEVTPHLSKTSLSSSGKVSLLSSMREKGTTLVLHRIEPELEVSVMNESLSSPKQTSDCNVSKSGEERSSNESIASQLISELAYGSTSSSRKGDSDCKKNYGAVNEQIRVMEKSLNSLIEKLYNQGNAEDRSEQEQAFVETAAEAAIRTSHLKLNNKNLPLLEKDVDHLAGILERIQQQMQDLAESQQHDLNVSFAENLTKTVELAKEKRDLLKRITQEQKVPLEPKAQFSRRTSSPGGMSRSKSLKQCSIQALDDNPVHTEVEKYESARRPLTLEKKSSEELFKYVSPFKSHETNSSYSERYDTNVVACLLTTQRAETPVRVYKVPLGKFSRFNDSRNKLTDRGFIGSTRESSTRALGMDKPKWEEFRAGFIQLALNIKSEFDATHPCHKILISDLLEEAFNENLSEEKWRDFIEAKYLKE